MSSHPRHNIASVRMLGVSVFRLFAEATRKAQNVYESGTHILSVCIDRITSVCRAHGGFFCVTIGGMHTN